MKRMLLVILLALFSCLPAKAQTGQVINCPLVNTTTFNSGPSSLGNTAISNCLFTQPPTAMAFFFVQGTVTCGANSDIWLDVLSGNNIHYQNFGASFNGQITGNVLTVNSMITSPPFVVLPPTVSGVTQRLYDAFSGSKIPFDAGSDDSALSIASQQTSTEPGGVLGGRGTYNLNTSVGTPVAAETMWALPYRSTAIATLSNTYEQFGCINGTTVIESFGGALPANFLGGQGFTNWVQVEIKAERIGGQPPQSASMINGQVFIVMPSMLQGGLGR